MKRPLGRPARALLLGSLLLGGCQGAEGGDRGPSLHGEGERPTANGAAGTPSAASLGAGHAGQAVVDQDVPGAVNTPATASPAPPSVTGPGLPTDLDDPTARVVARAGVAERFSLTTRLADGALFVEHGGALPQAGQPTLLGLRLTLAGPDGYRHETSLPASPTQSVDPAADGALADGLYRYRVRPSYAAISGAAIGAHPATDNNGRLADSADVAARGALPAITTASGAFRVVGGRIVDPQHEPAAQPAPSHSSSQP